MNQKTCVNMVSHLPQHVGHTSRGNVPHQIHPWSHQLDAEKCCNTWVSQSLIRCDTCPPDAGLKGCRWIVYMVVCHQYKINFHHNRGIWLNGNGDPQNSSMNWHNNHKVQAWIVQETGLVPWSLSKTQWWILEMQRLALQMCYRWDDLLLSKQNVEVMQCHHRSIPGLTMC